MGNVISFERIVSVVAGIPLASVFPMIAIARVCGAEIGVEWLFGSIPCAITGACIVAGVALPKRIIVQIGRRRKKLLSAG